MRSALLFLTVFTALSVISSVAFANTIYVSEQGTDSETCGENVSPCKTIPYAFGLAQINDDLLLLPGTYEVLSLVISKNNITLQASDIGMSYVRCVGLAADVCIDVQAIGFELHGIDFTGITQSVILQSNAIGFVVSRCTFDAISGPGTSPIFRVSNIGQSRMNGAINANDDEQRVSLRIEESVFKNIERKTIIVASSANIDLRSVQVQNLTYTVDDAAVVFDLLYTFNQDLYSTAVFEEVSFSDIETSILLRSESVRSPDQFSPTKFIGCTFTRINANIILFFAGNEVGLYRVVGCVFHDNTIANLIASGSIVGSGQDLQVADCVFSNNHRRPVQRTACIAMIGSGGASYPSDYDTVIENSIFTENDVPCVAAVQFSSVLLRNSSFHNNTAYSAVLESVGSAQLPNNQARGFGFINNTLIQNYQTPLVVYGNIDNTTNAHVVDVHVINSVFTHNNGTKAGAIFIRATDTTVLVSGSVFENNKAQESDGGLFACSALSATGASVLEFDSPASTVSSNTPRIMGQKESSCAATCDSTNKKLCSGSSNNSKSGGTPAWVWVLVTFACLAFVALVVAAGVFIRYRFLRSDYETL